MPEHAVSILRVSTKRQLNDGDGIENQRRGNLEHIRRRGYRLVREFVVAESAEGDEREEFEEAIRQSLRRELGVSVIVFWKVDRISRGGVLPYYTLKGVLAKSGVRIEFATEQIDDSATGELTETLLAGMARFENRLRVERTIGVSRILTKDGYWCRGAPTGFRVGRLDGKPVLLPRDPAQWALIRAGLMRVLDGAATPAAVGRELREQGVRSNHGTPLLHSTWHTMCRSPVYGGLICEPWTNGQFVRARFDGPLTPDEWHALQRRLDGRDVPPAMKAARKSVHPDFPLRRFLGCPTCRRPVRGYFARGTLGGRFAYYDCRHPGCRFRARADAVHDAFERLLARVTPSEAGLARFREAVLRAWVEAVAAERATGDAVGTRRQEVAEEKRRLMALMKRAVDKPALLADLEAEYLRLESDTRGTAATRPATPLADHDPEAVVDHCLGVARRSVELWRTAQPEAKVRFLRLVFPEGLGYDELTGCRTPRLSLLYRMFDDAGVLRVELAGQTDTPSNLLFEALLQWYRALSCEMSSC